MTDYIGKGSRNCGSLRELRPTLNLITKVHQPTSPTHARSLRNQSAHRSFYCTLEPGRLPPLTLELLVYRPSQQVNAAMLLKLIMLHILGYSQQTLDHPWLPGCPVPRWSRGISQFCFKVIRSLLCLYVDHQPPAIKVALSKVRFGTKGGTPYLTLNSCPSSWNATPTTQYPVRLDSCICI